MKCLLWYGFMTGDDKTHLNQYIAGKLKEAGIHEYTCVELTMNSIRKDTMGYSVNVPLSNKLREQFYFT